MGTEDWRKNGFYAYKLINDSKPINRNGFYTYKRINEGKPINCLLETFKDFVVRMGRNNPRCWWTLDRWVRQIMAGGDDNRRASFIDITGEENDDILGLKRSFRFVPPGTSMPWSALKRWIRMRSTWDLSWISCCCLFDSGAIHAEDKLVPKGPCSGHARPLHYSLSPSRLQLRLRRHLHQRHLMDYSSDGTFQANTKRILTLWSFSNSF